MISGHRYSSLWTEIHVYVLASASGLGCVNLLAEEINVIKKNTETLWEANKEVRVEVNAEKTDDMFMSRHQTAGQNYYTEYPYKMYTHYNTEY
jgi:hypothetical protein